MKFGLCFGISGREPISRVASLAESAESYGFDCIWFIDSPLVAKDVYVTMTLAAMATQTLKIGTGVTVAQLRHPVATTSAIATLDEVADGRVMLGLGSGDSAVKPMGFRPVKVDDLAQYVRTMRGLLAGEATGLPPTLEHVVKIAAAPRPVPIFVAAGLERMLTMAGSVADGVIIMGPNRSEWMRWQVDQVLTSAQAAGRSRNDLVLDLWTTISVSDDLQQATKDIKPWVAAQARSLQNHAANADWLAPYRSELDSAADAYDFRHHLSRGAPHGDTVSDGLARAVAIAGPVSECVERLQSLVDLGVDRITMTLLPGDRERRLRVLGEEVLPAIRPAKLAQPERTHSTKAP